MTELLICGECRTPYRRCTWTVNGQKKIVWRCISRLDYGKKYCRFSPSVEEGLLQAAIMEAVIKTSQKNSKVLKDLSINIGMGLQGEPCEDKSIEIKIRIAEIDEKFKQMLDTVSTDTADLLDEDMVSKLMNEKSLLLQEIEQYTNIEQKRENTQSRFNEIHTILEGLRNHPIKYDDQIARQMLKCVIVESKETIKVIFTEGTETKQELMLIPL